MNKRLEEILECCKTYLEKETDNMDTIGICKRIVSIIEEPYDLMIRKIISVYKQRVHCMTIPSKFVKVMKIKCYIVKLSAINEHLDVQGR